MKKTSMLVALLAAAAGLALAQCPPGAQCPSGTKCHGMQGQVIEKREIRMQGEPGEMRGQGMGMRGQWWKDAETVKALALSDKQQKDIEDLTVKHHKEMIKLDADLKILRVDMHQLIEDNGSDSDIRAQAKKVSQLKQKMSDAMLDHMLDLRRILTPDQQKKLQEVRKSKGPGQMMKMDFPEPDQDK